MLIGAAAIVSIIQTGSSKLVNLNLKDINIHSVCSKYDYRGIKRECHCRLAHKVRQKDITLWAYFNRQNTIIHSRKK